MTHGSLFKLIKLQKMVKRTSQFWVIEEKERGGDRGKGRELEGGWKTERKRGEREEREVVKNKRMWELMSCVKLSKGYWFWVEGGM